MYIRERERENNFPKTISLIIYKGKKDKKGWWGEASELATSECTDWARYY